MRRIETESSGESVVTRTVHILESDCVLLVQEIKDAKGNIETRNTITLSRDDINALCDEYATSKK